MTHWLANRMEESSRSMVEELNGRPESVCAYTFYKRNGISGLASAHIAKDNATLFFYQSDY